MKTIGSVESFTGGLFASAIVNKPGASKYFKGSIVTYNNDIKKKFGIDVSKGVINSKTALAMAKKGKKFFDVDICVAFTGNAGPKAMENKTPGHVFIAINNKVFKKYFKGNRNEIRKQAVEFAIKNIKF